jgi:hypothetical protein
MFGKDPSDLAQTLRTMQAEARERAKFNMTEARNMVTEMVKRDRRFDDFDPAKLVATVYDYAESGRSINWSDPSLKRGPDQRPQPKRPIVFQR